MASQAGEMTLLFGFFSIELPTMATHIGADDVEKYRIS